MKKKKPAMNWFFTLVIIAVVGYLSIVAGMYMFQRKLLYLPHVAEFSASDLGLKGVQEIIIKTNDGEQLQAWYQLPKPGNPTVLFFHGNGGSIAGRAGRMAFYQKQGIGALFVSYRGYGSSTGNPTQEGLITDAVASYDWLQANHAPATLLAVGESLGSSVAVQLARRRKIDGLIMEAPFTSTVDVAKAAYWWLPVALLMKDKFETIKIIDKITVPIVIVHGSDDEITNVELGKQVFEKAQEPKQMKIINTASHNAIQLDEVWQSELDMMTILMARNR